MMAETMKRFEQGFAYIWVLVAVALLGLGLVLGSELISTQLQRDKERELLAIGRQFRVAIGRYREARTSVGRQEYPKTLDDLVKDPRFGDTRRHLRKMFVDPMTGKAAWGEVRVDGRIVGVHSLSGRIPIKQDRFESDEMNFQGRQKYSEWVFVYPPDILMQQGGLLAIPQSPASAPLPPASAASASP